jgi:hypothetical protein
LLLGLSSPGYDQAKQDGKDQECTGKDRPLDSTFSIVDSNVQHACPQTN